MMRHSRNSWLGYMAILATFTLLPYSALAQTPAEGEIPARLRHYEGSVSIQRAAVGTTESALNNLPVSKGDRVWTDADGRAEIVFNDGSTLWLDHSTTIDVVSLRPRLRDPEAILRLWAGSVYLHRPVPQAGSALKELRIDAGAGSTLIEGSGLYRVDVDNEQRVWLSVYSGAADLLAGGLIESLSAGQQSYAELDSAPAHAVAFNTAEQDDFAAWRGRLVAQSAPTERYVREVSNYVPREIVHHVYDLEGYGSWTYYDAYGSWGWRPSVAVGWSPYRHGRWVYSWYGWVWVPFSPWGYVTAHYGRWDYVGSYGWCWFPGRRWGPAWVQWYVSPHHVGWVPLNYYNRPVVSINVYGNVYGGINVGGRYPTAGLGGRRPAIGPQGSASGTGKLVKGLGYTAGKERAWTFVEAGQLGSDNVGRVALDRSAAAAVARSDDGSRALIAGPLRARSPSRVTPTSSSQRVAVARGDRVEGRMGSAAGSPSPSQAGQAVRSSPANGRVSSPRAVESAQASRAPQSPMSRAGRTSRAEPTAPRAAPRAQSASSSGRVTGQPSGSSLRGQSSSRSATPRPSAGRSSSATRSPTAPGSRPPSMTRPTLPRSSSVGRASPPRSSPSSGSAAIRRPGTSARSPSSPPRSPTIRRPGTTVRPPATSRPSSGASPGAVRPPTMRVPSGSGRAVIPRGGSVARPPGGSRPSPGVGARAPARSAPKPSRSGAKAPRKAKPKGG